MRGLADYEARLEIAGERYAPDLPRWQGEPVDGPAADLSRAADIESDAAMRDTLMLARGVDAVVQCGATLAELAGQADDRARRSRSTASPPPRRCAACRTFWAGRSMPCRRSSPTRLRGRASRIGWFSQAEPPAGIDIERNPES